MWDRLEEALLSIIGRFFVAWFAILVLGLGVMLGIGAVSIALAVLQVEFNNELFFTGMNLFLYVATGVLGLVFSSGLVIRALIYLGKLLGWVIQSDKSNSS